jgi:ABC-type oligopeptide transport system ATPase subunit
MVTIVPHRPAGRSEAPKTGGRPGGRDGAVPRRALSRSGRASSTLLEQLKEEQGLSYLFVAHDLSAVRHIADRVAVMYLGRPSEIGEVDEVFERPSHPYTQALLSAIPLPDPIRERCVLSLRTGPPQSSDQGLYGDLRS